MKKLFNPEIEKQLQEVFENLTDKVTIALFTKDSGCETCPDTKQYMEEISALSSKIDLAYYSIDQHKDLAEEYNVKMVPSMVLLDAEGKYKGVKFNGIPAGHEINSFIGALMEVSGTESPMPEDLTKRIEAIEKPVNIKVFVTLGCPHCPGAVQKAHKLALMNANIDAEMIEAQSFPELSDKFNVSSVPQIVINDKYSLVGNQPIEAFLKEIEKA